MLKKIEYKSFLFQVIITLVVGYFNRGFITGPTSGVNHRSMDFTESATANNTTQFHFLQIFREIRPELKIGSNWAHIEWDSIEKSDSFVGSDNG